MFYLPLVLERALVTMVDVPPCFLPGFRLQSTLLWSCWDPHGTAGSGEKWEVQENMAGGHGALDCCSLMFQTQQRLEGPGSTCGDHTPRFFPGNRRCLYLSDFTHLANKRFSALLFLSGFHTWTVDSVYLRVRLQERRSYCPGQSPCSAECSPQADVSGQAPSQTTSPLYVVQASVPGCGESWQNLESSCCVRACVYAWRDI